MAQGGMVLNKNRGDLYYILRENFSLKSDEALDQVAQRGYGWCILGQGVWGPGQPNLMSGKEVWM